MGIQLPPVGLECLTSISPCCTITKQTQSPQGKEVSAVLWKMITVPLQKGSIFAFDGDSVPFWKANGHLHPLG